MIEVRNISKSYGDVTVFDNWSHDFPTGAVTCVMGASGLGKTTLLRLIMGLEQPDKGMIALPEDTRFACVFQEDRLISHLSALKNLRLVQSKRDDGEIKKLLTELGLEGSVTKPVRELSGGMARRVSIARCLIHPANTLLMDEPLKGLDVNTRLLTAEVIKKRAQGKTLLLVTHDREDAAFFGGETVEITR